MKFVTALLLSCVAIAIASEEYKDHQSDGCVCGRIYLPVCASNGKTYPNECEFRCVQKHRNADLRITREGVCEESG